MNFLVVYEQKLNKKNEKSREGEYLRGKFLFDFITAIPFFFLLDQSISQELLRLCLLLKVTRLATAFKLLDHNSYIREVKAIVGRRIMKMIEKDKIEHNEDLTKDRNYISFVLLTSRILKTAYLILLLLSVSYFAGLLWYLLSDMFGLSIFPDPD